MTETCTGVTLGDTPCKSEGQCAALIVMLMSRIDSSVLQQGEC